MNELHPRTELLWRGALRDSIAHAIFVAGAPFMSHSQSWEGLTFSVQDSCGSQGTIAFGEDRNRFVAAFYSVHSQRQPIGKRPSESRSRAETLRTQLLEGIPVELVELSQRALSYLLQDVDGEAVPVITSAFWRDGAGLACATESWPDLLDHGAFIIERHLLPDEDAISDWENQYDFDESAVALAFAIFKRRLAASGTIELEPAEIDHLRQRTRDEAGLSASLQALAEIGIACPVA